MAQTSKSFLQSVKQVLFPTSSSDPVSDDSSTSKPVTAASLQDLFPKVDPEIAGSDCDHDCDSCTVSLPRNFKIEENDELYGRIQEWSTHMLVATGKSDWVRDVADEAGSLMEAIQKGTEVKPSNGRMMLSASNIPLPSDSDGYASPTTVLLLPAWIFVGNVTPQSANTLITEFVDLGPTSSTPLGKSMIPRSLSNKALAEGLTSWQCHHSALILLCSQGTRDARCGQSAPLLRKEFGRHLRLYGLDRDLDDERPGGVGIYFISHVGGHKYSANVMIYRKDNAFGVDDMETHGKISRDMLLSRAKDADQSRQSGASQCVWLARVRPEDCEGIIKYTVLQGKLVKPEKQLRGGFDRRRKLLSW
ncbi:hypothetical protein K3495_g7315 [Podosphaera aphanis]|nr:hypothetical protein K3495_g7315 [Podosphaera aphanis]